MAYQTLYRKWRPVNFDQVVGQNHITSTLKNEIINNKTAHAYVFTGTRGTGKTSTAKILSRALNCENPIDGNPCNECPSCRGIMNETILDVVEMDAASNTGVENIREIIDQVRYSTASTKYKVYIIDEVHMLSIGAFNALLKTLEEPPSHVVFILATTEIHKIPATILSRCQRFDFKNISSADIADAVEKILISEGVSITRDAVEYIAYLGNGSMRDALSITEQCLAYKSNDISYADTIEILGTLDDEFLYRTAEHIAKGDVKSVLIDFDESMKKGKNPSGFAEGMLKAMRDILLYKLAPEICDFTSGKKQLAEITAPLYSKEKLTRCIDILSCAMRDIKLTLNPSVLVECTLVRITMPDYESDLSALVERISMLEQRLSNAQMYNTVKTPVQEEPAQVQPSGDTHMESITAPETASQAPKSAPTSKDSSLQAVIAGWKEVIRWLEGEGRLITFVSLYGVTPREENGELVLGFETKDGASKFSSGGSIGDVKEAVRNIFGLEVKIKCICEDKIIEPETDDNGIFKKLAEISTNNPENFKID